jgi:MATE family multidrug resistance protein
MLCMLVGYWLVGAPLGLYLCDWQSLGVTGLWMGLAVGTGITTALTLLRLPAAWPWLARLAGMGRLLAGAPRPLG